MIDPGAFPASPVTLPELMSGAFNAPPNLPGQAKSREKFKWLIETDNKPVWWEGFEEVRDKFPHFKKWEVWALISWASLHPKIREPRTLQEFADFVGKTTKALLNYRKKTYGDLPTVDEAIVRVKLGSLMHRRRNILKALADVAEMPIPQAHADRKLALEMLGDYRPKETASVTIDLPADSNFEKALNRAYGEPVDNNSAS